jgi:hypothetical protein
MQDADILHIDFGIIVFIFNIIFIIDTFMKPINVFSKFHSRLTRGYTDNSAIDWGNTRERIYYLYGLFILNFCIKLYFNFILKRSGMVSIMLC